MIHSTRLPLKLSKTCVALAGVSPLDNLVYIWAFENFHLSLYRGNPLVTKSWTLVKNFCINVEWIDFLCACLSIDGSQSLVFVSGNMPACRRKAFLVDIFSGGLETFDCATNSEKFCRWAHTKIGWVACSAKKTAAAVFTADFRLFDKGNFNELTTLALTNFLLRSMETDFCTSVLATDSKLFCIDRRNNNLHIYNLESRSWQKLEPISCITETPQLFADGDKPLLVWKRGKFNLEVCSLEENRVSYATKTEIKQRYENWHRYFGWFHKDKQLLCISNGKIIGINYPEQAPLDPWRCNLAVDTVFIEPPTLKELSTIALQKFYGKVGLVEVWSEGLSPENLRKILGHQGENSRFLSALWPF